MNVEDLMVMLYLCCQLLEVDCNTSGIGGIWFLIAIQR